MSPAVAAGVYVVWCEDKFNVCENRLGELRNEGVGVFGAVPLSLEWVCFDKTSGETLGS